MLALKNHIAGMDLPAAIRRVARHLPLGKVSVSFHNRSTIMNDVANANAPTDKRSTPLSKASNQEIQLELIRRRQFHAFDGERVVNHLSEHRDLWEAVMMDRLAISHPGSLPTLGLMKLRDLPRDEWNVDTLYILTGSREDAEQLAQSFNQRRWGGMVDVHADPEEVDNALGGAKLGQAIVSIWWD